MKYKLNNEKDIFKNNKTLFKIESLKDFDFIKIGDKGGFIEKESNFTT